MTEDLWEGGERRIIGLELEGDGKGVEEAAIFSLAMGGGAGRDTFNDGGGRGGGEVEEEESDV